MKLENHVVLVTGGGSGIGLAIARELLGRNNTVFVSARNRTKLAEAKRDNPGLRTLESDVTDIAQSKAALDAVMKESGRLSILINNAGIMLSVLPPRTSTDLNSEVKKSKTSAESVAREMLRGMSRDQFEIPIGESRTLRTMERIAPAFIERRLLAMGDPPA